MKNIHIYSKLPSKVKLIKESRKHICRFICFATIFFVTRGGAKEVRELKAYNADLMNIKSQTMTVGEKEILEICSINTKNKYLEGDDSDAQLAELITQDIDIIATQETPFLRVNEIENQLEDYQITGEPRWNDGFYGHLFAMANETNSIITNESIYMSRTTTLPWIPRNMKEVNEVIEKLSIMPRICTHCVIKTNSGNYIRVYNTHLDYGSQSIQLRQMQALLEIIKNNQQELPLPIIITGDFNAEPQSDNMMYFINELKKLNIHLANINTPTYKVNTEESKQVDYIFVSQDLTMQDVKVIENPQSDHEIIYTSVTTKGKKRIKEII